MPQFAEITTTNRSRRSRNGLILHETQSLDVTLRHDLPVTTPIRTRAAQAPHERGRSAHPLHEVDFYWPEHRLVELPTDLVNG
jgi:hypothetical protein